MPALPEKNVVEKYKMTTEFIEQRRAALTVFINRVVSLELHSARAGGRRNGAPWCRVGLRQSALLLSTLSTPALRCQPTPPPQASHPGLKDSKELQLFLEASETEFAIEVSRTQVTQRGGGRVPLLGGVAAVPALRSPSMSAAV